MSDTPKTDADEYQVFDDYNCAVNVVNSALARQLERELAESREQEKIHYDNCMSLQAERDRLAAKLKYETEQATERIADLEREHAGARNRANFFESAMREQCKIVTDVRQKLSDECGKNEKLIEALRMIDECLCMIEDVGYEPVSDNMAIIRQFINRALEGESA